VITVVEPSMGYSWRRHRRTFEDGASGALGERVIQLAGSVISSADERFDFAGMRSMATSATCAADRRDVVSSLPPTLVLRVRIFVT